VRALRIASGLEALSLAVLLLNLATVHASAVTSLGGPVHGTAYLAVIVLTWLMPAAAAPGVRWRALVPGVGGLLVLRRLRVGTTAGTRPT
jgi:hypothetical protein